MKELKRMEAKKRTRRSESTLLWRKKQEAAGWTRVALLLPAGLRQAVASEGARRGTRTFAEAARRALAEWSGFWRGGEVERLKG